MTHGSVEGPGAAADVDGPIEYDSFKHGIDMWIVCLPFPSCLFRETFIW